MQFTLEALCISSFDGILGILMSFSAVFSFLLNQVWDLSFKSGTSFTDTATCQMMSLFVGLSAGMYPAFKASEMNPVDAISQE